ncbi:hypothetical protein RRG08_049888 [Elysia crispata]|uniref:Uncharacterized protein n=1 Tax=Elysia crispata TaxID=231223 RepID=A0AAE0XZI2_9GAST|nr:hypothetical protein RRG08_049888 [Elysia crispata]
MLYASSIGIASPSQDLALRTASPPRLCPVCAHRQVVRDTVKVFLSPQSVAGDFPPHDSPLPSCHPDLPARKQIHQLELSSVVSPVCTRPDLVIISAVAVGRVVCA